VCACLVFGRRETRIGAEVTAFGLTSDWPGWDGTPNWFMQTMYAYNILYVEQTHTKSLKVKKCF
jgi:hypothetical protein